MQTHELKGSQFLKSEFCPISGMVFNSRHTNLVLCIIFYLLIIYLLVYYYLLICHSFHDPKTLLNSVISSYMKHQNCYIYFKTAFFHLHKKLFEMIKMFSQHNPFMAMVLVIGSGYRKAISNIHTPSTQKGSGQ